MNTIVTNYTTEKADTFIREKLPLLPNSIYRPSYHITAPVGWINDPNGLVYFKGEYHAFYQYYPYGTEWGPMHWGHVKSKDLLIWEHLPVALAPEYEYEKGGCFSGSAVVHHDKLYLIYTGHNEEKSPKEVQCAAVSEDGIHFDKFPAPIIPSLPAQASEDFRDPKVTWRNGKWYLFIGTSYNNRGRLVYYTSENLTNWSYQGIVLEGGAHQGTMWECVDLFSLEDKDVLIYSPMGLMDSKTRYIVGNWNKDGFETLTEGEIDHGTDFYAPQTFEDAKGRRILIGWMNMWEKAMEEKKEGWAGALTLPRELSLLDNHLVMTPVAEWKDAVLKKHPVAVKQENPQVNLEFTHLFFHYKGRSDQDVEWSVTSGQGDAFTLHVDSSKKHIMLNRTGMLAGEKDCLTVPLPEEADQIELEAFIDHSAFELFINHQLTVSLRIYFQETNVVFEQLSPDNETLIYSYE
ncbi:glycoside hydrolase family 32 protein [Alkalicoccus daliensis]|uniref:Sucrose-6-phosphate hydrolase n=1 Tax=Alkalicoccus daliensis TaxID=745820 RepID=A0A1H0GF72_9BACI|nr:glycoside hydrolase family 32 protein [Alkalicoccus daliensis]SDO05512.1 beta-fructofuranosidase [Alkalicoccus daliensis]